MYLSRIQINPVRRGATTLLRSPHAMHAAVLASFPDSAPTEAGRVLWRLDRGETKTYVYVVSPEPPDFTSLAEQAGWPQLPDTSVVRSYARLLDGIREGDLFRFRLSANPVHSKRLHDGQRGKVFGHVTPAQQVTWLNDRAARHGFAIEPIVAASSDDQLVEHEALNVRVIERRTLQFSRREARVTLSVATFEGVLRVLDRDAMVATLSFGLGRAKGYGCGLMTLDAVR